MVIDNIECVFIEHNLPSGGESAKGRDIPVFIWPNFRHQGNETEHLLECLSDKGVDTPFVLASFFVENWNRDLSPWPGPAVFGDEVFSGEGNRTLDWIDRSLIPFITELYGNRFETINYFMMGYSLAGLFSLWSVYEKDYFKGCIAASPSVWFPKWEVYAADKNDDFAEDSSPNSRVEIRKIIYLSIGEKEEKTKNAIMKTVGDRIRWQFKILDENPNVRVTFEYNQGGHFADSGERLAKGITWLSSGLKKLTN